MIFYNKFLQIFLSTLLLLTMFPMKNHAETATSGSTISGVISEDRVLTKDGSPYYQTGMIEINSGVTLTMEPGVELIGQNGSWISVRGQLKAVGTEQERIRLQDVYVQGSNFEGSFVQIEYADHYRQSRYNGGFLVTTIGKNAILRHNQYKNGSISISSSKLNSSIEYNFFSEKADLSVANGPGEIFVKNNTFMNPIDSYNDLTVRGDYGDGGIPNIHMNQNNFFGWPHTKVIVQVSGYNRLLFDANDNYWGVTDPLRIERGITDGNDNSNFLGKLDIGTVAYKPFENGHPIGTLEKPFVEKLSDRDTLVSGITDQDSQVEVYQGTEKIGEGPSGTDGSFQIPIPPQKSGVELTIKSTDSYNRVSPETVVTVGDETPPEAPVVDAVTEHSQVITGKAEPFSTVEAKATISLGKIEADEQGHFSIAIEKQTAGTMIQITATDVAGNISPAATAIVADITAPAAPQLNQDSITDLTDYISGYAEKGALISVIAGQTILGSRYVSSDYFSIIFERQPAGTEIEVRIEDASKNKGESIYFTVKDVTPPSLKLSLDTPNTVTTEEITGVAEAGAHISIFNEDVLIAEGDANPVDGLFKIPIGKQRSGTYLRVIATDAVNNVSPPVFVTVKDITPPPIKINTVTNRTTQITGVTEAGSSVSIAMVGHTYFGYADSDGKFSFQITPPTPGATFYVTIVDAATNQSLQKFVVVKVRPNSPTVNPVTNKATTVTGVTVKSAVVTVKAGASSYKGNADANGKFTVAIPAQNSGTVLSVTATDAGGTSLPKTLQVTRIAPNIPVVNAVNNKSAWVTGKTEKYAIMTVQIGSKYYNGKADSVGNFKVSIPIQNSGTSLKITAKDAAGKISNPKSLTVARVAPNLPVVNAVKYTATSVTGKTEKLAVVKVWIGNRMYWAKANSYGSFKVNIPRQKRGTSFSVTATDAKGLTSAARTVKVY
ncbi:Ig-like domain-containing protein [Bacillus sp. AFS031507]|uniref:Ig-like domain-containing protein n=1 Tax=Bacillus sp. AFS031507 TaxID=2033496 RepID=UPI000BFB4F77|nr:Ig-like domain-containing protein [Bacillus sp. AFS031507]